MIEPSQRAEAVVASVWTATFAGQTEGDARYALAKAIQAALNAERADALRFAAGMVGAAFGGMGELRDAIEAEADKITKK